MPKKQLFIPEKLKVGFKQRSDTYNGYLAYVIYYDAKGVLRKETSWQNWRHKEEGYAGGRYGKKRDPDPKLTPRDMKNVPTSGFVLNKGVGGVRESWGWNVRNEYIRVFDPRGIEFEISVANLIFILAHVNCIKRELQGDFVYSWDGKELVLLPTCTDEYKASSSYTQLQGKKIGARDLVEGHLYETKDQKQYVFLGRYDWWFMQQKEKYNRRSGYEYTNKKHRFFMTIDGKNRIVTNNLSFLAREIGGGVVVPNYAKLLEELKKEPRTHKMTEVFPKPISDFKEKVLRADSEIEKTSWGGASTIFSFHTLEKKGLYRSYRILRYVKDSYLRGVGVYSHKRVDEDTYFLEPEGYVSFDFENNEFSSQTYMYRHMENYAGVTVRSTDLNVVIQKAEGLNPSKIMFRSETGGDLEFKSIYSLKK